MDVPGLTLPRGTRRAGQDPGARILIVEDERIIARELEDRLTRMGHEVVGSVGSGEDAIDIARELRPDLVLMDIKLHGLLDGIEAAWAIQSEMELPIVYLTAFADEDTLQRAKLTQPYGYLLKPFQDRELQVSIEVWLHCHRAMRARRERDAWRHALLQSAGDAIIGSDVDGDVRLINRHAEALTGWSAREALGRPVDEVFKDLGAPEAPHLGSQGRLVRRIQTRDGSERSVEEELATIRDPNGAVLGSVRTFRSADASARAEEHLRGFAAAMQLAMESREPETLLTHAAELVARHLADGCLVYMAGEHDGPGLAVRAHRDPSVGPLHWRAERAPSPAEAGLSVAHAQTVPATAGDRVLATLTLVSQEAGRDFTSVELAVAQEVGRCLAGALERARHRDDDRG